MGSARDIRDSGTAHRVTLAAFLAWVGLGADPLSSSAYGPEETFKTLGQHTSLAVVLAAMTAGTVTLLAMSYSRIIEHFPHGGGGYVVAGRVLGGGAGLVSGCALLVDYVLTITVSAAAAGEALFSLLPSAVGSAELAAMDWPERLSHAHGWKLPFEAAVILVLVVANLRGVKESVLMLAPIFVVFLVTHAVVIGAVFVGNAGAAGETVTRVGEGFGTAWTSIGLAGMVALTAKAFAMGGGTYTGIEAVSNGLAIMREPRVATAKRTMTCVAVSLSVTAGGLLIAYLLCDLRPVEGVTMNALLTGRAVEGWGGWGQALLWATLVSEAALLIVAAQAGFLDGPRVMASMAADSWLPHRFAALSERLTIHNGILIIGAAAAGALLYTGGRVDQLVAMYSINVFLTFTLSQAAMWVLWFRRRAERPDWRRRSAIFAACFALCATVLVVTIIEKFADGGRMTLLVTAGLVGVCLLVKRHYRRVGRSLAALDAKLEFPAEPSLAGPPGEIDRRRPVAVVLVGAYGGPGLHTLLGALRLMPDRFAGVVFVSVGVVDSGNYKGGDTVAQLEADTRANLDRWRAAAARLGLPSEARHSLGTDVVEEAEKLCLAVAADFPKAVFFAGKLLMPGESFLHRLLHNGTADALQRRLQWSGHPMVIVPLRIMT